MGWDSGQLNTIRTDGQFSELFLSFLKPVSVYTALVNGIPSSNDRVAEIDYDNGVGILADVLLGMTIRFGTTPGARDLGEERVRKTPTSSKFYFGETSDISFQDNSYITVVDDYQLREKHLRVSNGIFYVDYDIPYTNQHTSFDPIVKMGGHVAAWLEDGSVDIPYGQFIQQSKVFGSSISSYLTTCAGATVTGSTTNDPVITIDTPGRYLVYTTLTAANGKSFTGVRYIRVHDETDLPLSEFELISYDGSYEGGGFSATVRCNTSDIDVDLVEEGCVAILHSRDYYNGTLQVIENYEKRGNVRLSGRVDSESVIVDPEINQVEFTIIGFHEQGRKSDEMVFLSGIAVNSTGAGNAFFSLSKGHVSRNYFPFGLEMSKNTPSKWTDMPLLTVELALFELFHQYSTVSRIMDINIETDSRYAAELNSSAGTIWDKIVEIASLSIFSNPGVDQWGRLFVEVEPQLVPVEDRDADIIMEITDADIVRGSLAIDRIPTQRGDLEVFDRILLSNQSQSNKLSGLMHSFHHNEFKSIRMDFARNNPGFTIFPRQVAQITINPSDNIRGLSYDGNIIPREVSWNYDKKSGTFFPSIKFEGETFESANINGDVPGSGDISVLPPLPPLSLPLPTPVFTGDVSASPSGPPTVLLVDNNNGVLFSNNFNTDNVDLEWQFWNTGLTATDKYQIIDAVTDGANKNAFFRTPSGAYYLGIWEEPGTLFLKKLYYAQSLGAQWQLVVDESYMVGLLGGSFTQGWMQCIGYNPYKPDEVAIIVGGQGFGPIPDKVLLLGNGSSGFTQTGTWSSFAISPGNLTFGSGNRWLFDYFTGGVDYLVPVDAGFTTVGAPIEVTGGSGIGGFHTRASVSSVIYKVLFNDTMVKSIDDGATWATLPTTGTVPQGVYTSLDGSVVFNRQGTGRRARSLDGGFSWDSSFFTYGDYYCFGHCGGAGTESQWILGRGDLRFSDDGGANWIDKRGNLPYIIPIGMNIGKILVPGITTRD